MYARDLQSSSFVGEETTFVKNNREMESNRNDTQLEAASALALDKMETFAAGDVSETSTRGDSPTTTQDLVDAMKPTKIQVCGMETIQDTSESQEMKQEPEQKNAFLKRRRKNGIKDVCVEAIVESAISTLRCSNRQRKTVARAEFVLDSAEDSDASSLLSAAGTLRDVAIPSGQGTPLGSIKAFVSNYNVVGSKSYVVRKLCRVLYGVEGYPAERNNHLFQWKGLDPMADNTALYNNLVRLCTVSDLRNIGKKLFGMPSGANGKDTKQAWVQECLIALTCPNSAVVRENVGRESKSASQTNITGYQLFRSEMRERSVIELPNALHKDIMKWIGEKWRNLDDKEKQKYQQMSLRRRYSTGGHVGKRQRSGSRSTRRVKDDESEDLSHDTDLDSEDSSA